MSNLEAALRNYYENEGQTDHLAKKAQLPSEELPYEDGPEPKPAIRTFESGATRDVADHKHDYEGFVSVHVLRLFGAYMHKHRFMKDGSVRDSDNWQKGFGADAIMKSLTRHFMDVWEIHRDGQPTRDFDGNVVELEDALLGLFFNTQAYLLELIKDMSDEEYYRLSGRTNIKE